MNEVTTIHLGRQAYKISVDAHDELRTYIAAIVKKVNDTEVINEVEVRMSELLTERGINANKVVLLSDVEYLKSQLGEPADFIDEEEAPESVPDTKRLYRDTDNAIIAGVAAGLARFFGIDVLLVRILFIVLVGITLGWGILIYILLWLLVPEAKTSSERLQMAGRPVTVQSLKDVVGQADVKGAARRANGTLVNMVNTLFKFILKIVGVVFVAFGLTVLFGLIASVTYYLTRTTSWAQGNVFPIGFRENLLLNIILTSVGLITVFIILFGIAIFRRKWPIKTWITGVLAGLVFIGLAVGVALTADVYPTVHSAYLANTHTTTRALQPFSNLDVDDDAPYGINFVTSNKYMVALNYYGHPNLTTFKTTVHKGTLLIDTNNFAWQRDCATLCIPGTYRLNVTIYAPNAMQLENQQFQDPELPTPPQMSQ